MRANVGTVALFSGATGAGSGKGKGLGAVTPRPHSRQTGACQGEVRLDSAAWVQAIPSPTEAQGFMRATKSENTHTANLLTVGVRP